MGVCNGVHHFVSKESQIDPNSSSCRKDHAFWGLYDGSLTVCFKFGSVNRSEGRTAPVVGLCS